MRAWRAHHKQSRVYKQKMQEKFVQMQSRVLISSLSSLYTTGFYFFPGRDLQLGILSQEDGKGLAMCLRRQLELSVVWLASCIVLGFCHQEYHQADLVTCGKKRLVHRNCCNVGLWVIFLLLSFWLSIWALKYAG